VQLSDTAFLYSAAMAYNIFINYLTDINECSEGLDDCERAPRASCTDTEGSYICSCNSPYSQEGNTCTGLFR